MSWRIVMVLIAVALIACAAPVEPTATSSPDTLATLPSPPVRPTTIPSAATDPAATSTLSSSAVENTPAATPSPVPTNVRIEDAKEYEVRGLIPFDGIPPIYEPEFVPAADAPLVDDELVLGVAITGEAKAYPISVLRFREIVDDELGALPILVTW